jgi:hypothetical protein
MFTLEGTFLEGRKLVVRFKKINAEAKVEIHFERTLRIPDDGKTYPLPAGLGLFPMRYVADFEEDPARKWTDEGQPTALPPEWTARGGVVMPVYPSEAMWIAFGGGDCPCAIKIGVGGHNAVNGEPWSEELSDEPGDYIVTPPQQWLDGFYVGNNKVRQFVAQRQRAGQPAPGGIRIAVYPMKADRYQRLMADRRATQLVGTEGASTHLASAEEAGRELFLDLGGRMKQRIHADPHGLEAWDDTAKAICAVTLIDPEQWLELTRTPPPDPPTTREEYDASGLPWYEEYNSGRPTVDGSTDGDGPALSGAVDPGRVRRIEPACAPPPGGSRFARAFGELRRLWSFWGG